MGRHISSPQRHCCGRLRPISMRLSPITSLSLLAAFTTTTTLLLPATAISVAASAPAAQKAFRLGKPAAGLNTNAPPSGTRAYSTMSSVSLPPQDENFPGYPGPIMEPNEKTAQLVKDAQDLFSAKPSAEIFARSWDPKGIFADPIAHANGAHQYLAQWFGMPAAFSQSQTLAWKLTKQEPTEVQYVQKHMYKIKGIGMTKEMVSTVVMQLDPQTKKIINFEDRWNHKPLNGVLSWPFRRLNAVTLPLFISVPKASKEAVNRKEL